MRRRLLLAAATALIAGACHAADLRQPFAPAGVDVFDTLHDNAWYLPTADRTARLYVTEIGRGPTVVVLHGGAGNDFNYLVDAVRPAAKAYRFVLFDQRGSALSPVKDSAVATITLDTLVDDLETLRIALNQPRLILFAHSFGTLLALSYYQKYPDHVAGLVLTGSFSPQTGEGGLNASLKAIHGRIQALMARPEAAAVLKAEGLDGDPATLTLLQRSARSRILGFADFDLVHVERWRRLQGGGVFYNTAVDNAVGASLPATLDFRPTMAAHPIPMAIVQGDQDYVDPGAATWRDAPAHRLVISNAGHIAWIDNPAQFDAALLRALRGVVRSASGQAHW